MSSIDRLRAIGAGGSSSRGLSSVLGVVLVLGMVIAATMVIVTVGATSLSESESTVSVESAVTGMNEIDRTVSSIRGQPGSQASLSLPDDSEFVESGWVKVQVLDSSGTVQKDTGEITLGKMLYERDGQEVAYQAGGVWRGNGENSVMVSPPDLEYAGGKYPTLSFPISTLNGDKMTGDSYSIQANKVNDIPPSSLPEGPIKPGHEVQITIRSQYADAWAEYLRTETAGDVTKVNAETVRLTLSSTATSDVEGPLSTNPTHVDVDRASSDYYDSDVGKYPTSKDSGNTPRTIIRGDYAPQTGGDVIDSDVAVTGELTFTGGGSIEFGGDVIAGGSGHDIIKSETTVNGDLSVKGDLTFTTSGPKTVNGDLYVDGDLRIKSDLHVTGDVHVGGSIPKAKSNVYSIQMDGDLHVSGSVDSLSKDGSNPDTPLSPNVDPINYDYESEITTAVSNAKSSNDNSDHTGEISTIEVQGDASTTSKRCSPCTLTSGEYYLDQLDLSAENQQLNLDTDDGPISLYIDGFADVKNSDITITGEHSVEIYSMGNVDITKKSAIKTVSPEHDATRLTWYMRPGKDFLLKASTFTGFLDAPEAVINFKTGNSRPEVFGAIIGKIDSNSNVKRADFHFDNALRSSGWSSNSASNEVDFLRIKNPTLDIKNGD